MKKIGLFLLVIMCFCITACGSEKKENIQTGEIKPPGPVKEVSKFKIIDTTSNSRPYGVVINNYPSAVKVQSGLDKAYMIYEIPIEGGLSRSIAFFKDVDDVKLGTIRSARHNYLDYMYEHDAIFVHFGGSYTAYEHLKSTNYDHIDGNTTDGTPFKREKYENLATEHTVYTNLSKVIDYVTNTKKFRTTTDATPVLNYSQNEIELKDREDSQSANTVDVYYSNSFYVTYKYNETTKRYDRYFKGNPHVDYFTKKQYDCKNVIITFVNWGTVSDHKDAAGNNYLDLNNIGTGEGYYITNGYAVPITWEKKDRQSKTIYKYKDGKEIDVNDGNTWVMMTSKSKKYNIK